jgi:hypothetical protein
MKPDRHGRDMTPGLFVAWLLACAILLAPWIWMSVYL